MNLESQVVSLELANKLKELGVKQESLFYWKDKYTAIPDIYYNPSYGFKDKLSAFTVAELGGMLPIKINDKYLTTHRCSRKGWWIFYSSEDEDDKSFNSYWDASSEANIRARMLIHLIEKNLVKVEDINK